MSRLTRICCSCIAALALAAVLSAAPAYPAERGGFERCGDFSEIQTDVRVRNTSCQTARKVIRNLECANSDCSRYVSLNFDCRSESPGSGQEGGNLSCENGRKQVRWRVRT